MAITLIGASKREHFSAAAASTRWRSPTSTTSRTASSTPPFTSRRPNRAFADRFAINENPSFQLPD